MSVCLHCGVIQSPGGRTVAQYGVPCSGKSELIVTKSPYKTMSSFVNCLVLLKRYTGVLALAVSRLDLNSSDVAVLSIQILVTTQRQRHWQRIHHIASLTVDNSRMTMMSNDILNAAFLFLQGLLDEDGSMIGEEDDCIDDDGAVNDDKLEEFMDRQEAEIERKRNLLVSSSN